MVDVDPQEAGLADRVLVPAGGRPGGRGDEHFFAAIGVTRREGQQRPHPAGSTGLSAGQEVVGPAAGRDVQATVAPLAGGELHQPGGVLVQDPELERPVALRGEPPGEDPAVSEPHAAAQFLARALGAVVAWSGGGCGHRILPAQIWARPPSVPSRVRDGRRC